MAVEVLGITIYVWIAIVAFLFLVAIAVMGSFGADFGHPDGGFDYGDTGPGISPISPPLLATFGTGFGSIGALLEIGGMSPIIVAIGATVGALAISGGMYLFVARFLVRSQATTEVSQAGLVGGQGQVTVPIKRDAQGQILIITEERGRSLFPAVSGEDIPRDAIVEILSFAGGVANVRKKVG